jgi:hypothetical protein
VIVTDFHTQASNNSYKIYLGNGDQIIEQNSKNVIKWTEYNLNLFAISGLFEDFPIFY